MRYNLITE